jgi:hypothetical protein
LAALRSRIPRQGVAAVSASATASASGTPVDGAAPKAGAR